MSCLENDKINDELIEKFEIAFSEDYDLRGELAYRLLEGMEYHLFCKEDAYHYLDDLYDDILENISNEFWNNDYNCVDIRELCKVVYKLDF